MSRTIEVGVNFGEALCERKKRKADDGDQRDLNPMTEHEFSGFNVFGKDEGAEFYLVVKAAGGSVPPKRFPIHMKFVAASISLQCILEQTQFLNSVFHAKQFMKDRVLNHHSSF